LPDDRPAVPTLPEARLLALQSQALPTGPGCP